MSSIARLPSLLTFFECVLQRENGVGEASTHHPPTPTTGDLRFDEKGSLVSGTLDALVEHLKPSQDYYPDHTFVFAFLLSSRLFIKPHRLLDRILQVSPSSPSAFEPRAAEKSIRWQASLSESSTQEEPVDLQIVNPCLFFKEVMDDMRDLSALVPGSSFVSFSLKEVCSNIYWLMLSCLLYIY